MASFVLPEVYLVGFTTTDSEGMSSYLRDTGNQEFLGAMDDARRRGLSDGEIMCSFYAKLCYKSLTVGHNANISRTRDIPDNLLACFKQGHGSVFEHCNINFVATNVSRVLTHELVRHRVGTAFSQTSGRYVRGDQVDFVFDPILEPVRDEAMDLLREIELRYNDMVQKLGLDSLTDFSRRKELTSALRRFLPNGQANEIGFTVNLRQLRHMVQVRTSRQAEWEIRAVFSRVYELCVERFSMLFCDAEVELVDGLIEVSGMKMQPYG